MFHELNRINEYVLVEEFSLKAHQTIRNACIVIYRNINIQHLYDYKYIYIMRHLMTTT